MESQKKNKQVNFDKRGSDKKDGRRVPRNVASIQCSSVSTTRAKERIFQVPRFPCRLRLVFRVRDKFRDLADSDGLALLSTRLCQQNITTSTITCSGRLRKVAFGCY